MQKNDFSLRLSLFQLVINLLCPFNCIRYHQRPCSGLVALDKQMASDLPSSEALKSAILTGLRQASSLDFRGLLVSASDQLQKPWHVSFKRAEVTVSGQSFRIVALIRNGTNVLASTKEPANAWSCRRSCKTVAHQLHLIHHPKAVTY